MGKIYVFDHPLIQHKTAMIRDKNTGTKDFRQIVSDIVEQGKHEELLARDGYYARLYNSQFNRETTGRRS